MIIFITCFIKTYYIIQNLCRCLIVREKVNSQHLFFLLLGSIVMTNFRAPIVQTDQQKFLWTWTFFSYRVCNEILIKNLLVIGHILHFYTQISTHISVLLLVVSGLLLVVPRYVAYFMYFQVVNHSVVLVLSVRNPLRATYFFRMSIVQIVTI